MQFMGRRDLKIKVHLCPFTDRERKARRHKAAGSVAADKRTLYCSNQVRSGFFVALVSLRCSVFVRSVVTSPWRWRAWGTYTAQ